MRVLLTCAVCLAFGSRAFADDTLTLSQVIAAAVRTSPDLERASLDAKAAAAAAVAAQGIEDAHVGANAFYSTTRDSSTVQGSRDHDRNLGGEVLFTKLFSTGTSVTLAAGTGWQFVRVFNYADEDPAKKRQLCNDLAPPLLPSCSETTFYSSFGQVQVNQPLLRGAGATAVEGPIRDARLQRDAAELQREAKARDLIVAIVEAYWQVALAKAEREVRKISLDLANEQLRFTQSAIRASKVPEAELLAVQQVIATRQLDLIAAEQAIYDRSVALRQLAGLEIGPNAIEVETESLPAIDRRDIDMPGVVAAALERNPELAALTASTLAAQAGVDTANGLARSRLDLNVSAQTNGVDPGSTDETGVYHPGTMASSIGNVASAKAYELDARLTFDHAIEQRTERGTVAQARARLLRAKVDERAARARIASSSTRAVQRARAALASVTLGEAAIALAEQNIEIERKKFEAGRSSNFEVLRRQDELEAARLRHASAIVDYLSARAEIDGLTGQLLGRYGIVMH